MKNARIGTKSRPIPMILFQSRTLWTVSTVLKILLPISCSSVLSHFPQSNLNLSVLQVGGVTSEIKEDDLQQYFYQFGEIATINIVEKNCCAFVQFTKRESAEHAATKCYGRLDMKV